MNAKKWESYENYKWSNDEKWQEYFRGLYPVPSAKIVEKRKKTFYKKNVDKDFDVDYNPDAP
jgi:hypothetical protein